MERTDTRQGSGASRCIGVVKGDQQMTVLDKDRKAFPILENDMRCRTLSLWCTMRSKLKTLGKLELPQNRWRYSRRYLLMIGRVGHRYLFIERRNIYLMHLNDYAKRPQSTMCSDRTKASKSTSAFSTVVSSAFPSSTESNGTLKVNTRSIALDSMR